MRIVIIGNGVAGMEAALVVRERAPAARITLISEESDHFFSRTALMWVASGQLNHRDTEPLERDAYARLGLTRIRARALGVEVAEHRVRLAGGQPDVPYDRLLIASGSRPRVAPWPGGELRGVGYFVTHQDLAWLQREVCVERCTEPPSARAHLEASTPDSPYRFREAARDARGQTARAPLVIGGGLIGIEAVEVLVAAGLAPHFVMRGEWCWPMALDAREAGWVAERLEAHGVIMHAEHEVEALLDDGAGSVAAVQTDRGAIAADAVVVAIGVVPNTSWLGGSGIDLVDAAIAVDAGLATSAPDVFAAGDCAAVPWFDGSQRPEQLWYTARDQGRVAGRRLLGDAAQYERGLWYNSAKLMDIEYTTCGLVDAHLQDQRQWFFEERGAVQSTTRIALSGEQVVGFNLLGRRWDHSVLSRFIHERRSLPWVLEHLSEAAFDTEFVPPLRLPDAAVRAAPLAVAPPARGSAVTFPEHW